MAITTWESKKTINPPMLSRVADDMRKDDEVVEDSGELVDKTLKKVEVS